MKIKDKIKIMLEKERLFKEAKKELYGDINGRISYEYEPNGKDIDENSIYVTTEQGTYIPCEDCGEVWVWRSSKKYDYCPVCEAKYIEIEIIKRYAKIKNMSRIYIKTDHEVKYYINKELLVSENLFHSLPKTKSRDLSEYFQCDVYVVEVSEL